MNIPDEWIEKAARSIGEIYGDIKIYPDRLKDARAAVYAIAPLIRAEALREGEETVAEVVRQIEVANNFTYEAQHEVIALKKQKDGAYSERDRLVSALSKLFPSRLERHPHTDLTWENDWRWIVFIELPSGQASWHIHDSELDWFDHLDRYPGNSWDGHTTEEKYLRLQSLAAQSAPRSSEEG